MSETSGTHGLPRTDRGSRRWVDGDTSGSGDPFPTPPSDPTEAPDTGRTGADRIPTHLVTTRNFNSLGTIEGDAE